MRKYICFLSLIFLFILLPLFSITYAAGTPPNCTNAPVCGNDTCPAQLVCVVTIFPRVISAAFQVITSVIVIVVILAGIKFLRSGGDAKQVEGAWKIVTYAIIGFVIVFGSYFIINIIAYVTGVHCIQLLFGFTNCQ